MANSCALADVGLSCYPTTPRKEKGMVKKSTQLLAAGEFHAAMSYNINLVKESVFGAVCNKRQMRREDY